MQLVLETDNGTRLKRSIYGELARRVRERLPAEAQPHALAFEKALASSIAELEGEIEGYQQTLGPEHRKEASA